MLQKHSPVNTNCLKIIKLEKRYVCELYLFHSTAGKLCEIDGTVSKWQKTIFFSTKPSVCDQIFAYELVLKTWYAYLLFKEQHFHQIRFIKWTFLKWGSFLSLFYYFDYKNGVGHMVFQSLFWFDAPFDLKVNDNNFISLRQTVNF